MSIKHGMFVIVLWYVLLIILTYVCTHLSEMDESPHPTKPTVQATEPTSKNRVSQSDTTYRASQKSNPWEKFDISGTVSIFFLQINNAYRG